MTHNEPSEAELTERARQLSNDVEHLYGVVKRRKETERTARKQALKITGEATSPDGSIRATVDVGGMLTKLDLAPDVMGHPPDQLAQLIMSTTQQAAANARGTVQQIYTQLRNEGVLRETPILLPESVPMATPAASAGPRPRRRVVEDDEPSFEDAPSMLRSEDV